MSMISDHLNAEIIDPALPRDYFVPPSYDDTNEDLLDDVDTADLVDAESDDVE